MSTPPATKGVVQFLKSAWTGVAALIGVISSLAAFAQLVQNKAGVLAGVIWLSSLAALWAVCWFVFLSRTTASVIGYPRWARRLAMAGLVFVPVTAAAGLAAWQYRHRCPSTMTCVVIADFAGPDPEDYRVTRTIIEQVTEATKAFPEVRIERLGRAIAWHEGSRVAAEEARKRNAGVVLWGDYSRTKEKVIVTAHFELRHEGWSKESKESKEFYRASKSAPAAAIERFEVQEELSRQMTFLTLVVLGVARFLAHDDEGAIARLTEALNRPVSPGYPVPAKLSGIYFFRGTAYAAKARYDAAIADLTKAIQFRPSFPDAYYNRGFAYSRAGDSDRAIADFTQVISVDPSYTNAYLQRGLVHMGKEDYDSAIRDFTQSITLEPNKMIAYFDRGWAYRRKGDLDRAIADQTRAIQLDPSFEIAYDERVGAYGEKGDKRDIDRLMADLTQLINLRPNSANDYYARGLGHKEKGDVRRSIADFTRAIECNRDFAEAYSERGLAYLKGSNYDRAIADFTRAIALRSSWADPYIDRATAFDQKGDLDRAIADYTQALVLQPDLVEAHFLRGLDLKSKGRLKEAAADFRKVHELAGEPTLKEKALHQLAALGMKP